MGIFFILSRPVLIQKKNALSLEFMISGEARKTKTKNIIPKCKREKRVKTQFII